MGNEALRTELKLKLSITWEDADTDLRLDTIIADAIIAMNFKLGAEIDYSAPGFERQLFLNYCMYVWNNCTELFDNNYINDIYQIRQYYEAKAYEEEEADNAEL